MTSRAKDEMEVGFGADRECWKTEGKHENGTNNHEKKPVMEMYVHDESRY